MHLILLGSVSLLYLNDLPSVTVAKFQEMSRD